MKKEINIDRLLAELYEDRAKYHAIAHSPDVEGTLGMRLLQGRIMELDRLTHRLEAIRLVRG